MNEICFLGDIYLPNTEYSLKCDLPYIANLEYVASDSALLPVKNKINLRGDASLKSLSPLPVAVSLANNHIMDFLDAGFETTVNTLQKLGVGYFGAGCEDNNFNNPYIYECGEEKLAFLGYCDIVHILAGQETKNNVARPTHDRLCADIEKCKALGASKIIVNIHWGIEERPGYSRRQKELGDEFVKLGADIVIGHHPHCIQPVAVINGKFVFYSLGNSLFPNISARSYMDENGNGGFLYSKRHLTYGRKSLAVIFDADSGAVRIKKAITSFQKKKVIFQAETTRDRIIPKAFRHGKLSDLAGLLRMGLLFAKSNLFVDGKILNTKAVAKEFEFIAARKGRKK